MNRIYLAGAISDAPDSGMPWRRDVEDRLSEGIEVDNPLDRIDVTDSHVEVVEASSEPDAVLDGDLIVSDKSAIESSDVLLVNWQSNLIKTGTPMEVLFAYERGIPVVVWHSDRVREELSPWIRFHASYLHERFEDAVDRAEDLC